MKRLFGFFSVSVMLFVCVAQESYAHRFYAAFTQIDIREEKQTMEIVHRLFTHDVEDFLRQKLGNASGLSDEEIEPIIKELVEGAFALYDNHGRRLSLSWIGMEYKTDNVYVYQEAALPSDPSEFFIINRLFMELFDDQKNTVNVEWKEDIRTRIFLKGHDQQGVSFKKKE